MDINVAVYMMVMSYILGSVESIIFGSVEQVEVKSQGQINKG